MHQQFNHLKPIDYVISNCLTFKTDWLRDHKLFNLLNSTVYVITNCLTFQTYLLRDAPKI